MTTQTSTRITAALHAPVARIVLQNPPLNIIDLPMMDELSQVLAEIESRADISVLVMSGGGTAFSAGVDVAAHIPDKVESMLSKFHGVIRALLASKKITIAAVHGHCLGGGAELAMICDLVFTADTAQWGFPEINLGCYPPVACTALAALVGPRHAAEFILTGRIIDGAQAHYIGLVNRAVPEERLQAEVEACLIDLSHLSPTALGLAKKANYAWDSIHFDKGLARAEKIYLEELMKTEDAQEGINAFLQKRKPVWKGK